MTFKAIEKLLNDAGISDVMTIRDVMKATGLSYPAIHAQIQQGKITKIDRGVISRDSFIRWIIAKPRYLPRVYAKLTAKGV